MTVHPQADADDEWTSPLFVLLSRSFGGAVWEVIIKPQPFYSLSSGLEHSALIK